MIDHADMAGIVVSGISAGFAVVTFFSVLATAIRRSIQALKKIS